MWLEEAPDEFILSQFWPPDGCQEAQQLRKERGRLRERETDCERPNELRIVWPHRRRVSCIKPACSTETPPMLRPEIHQGPSPAAEGAQSVCAPLASRGRPLVLTAGEQPGLLLWPEGAQRRLSVWRPSERPPDTPGRPTHDYYAPPLEPNTSLASRTQASPAGLERAHSPPGLASGSGCFGALAVAASRPSLGRPASAWMRDIEAGAELGIRVGRRARIVARSMGPQGTEAAADCVGRRAECAWCARPPPEGAARRPQTRAVAWGRPASSSLARLGRK